MRLEILPAVISNTKNFVTANGSSRETIALNDSHNGLMSSNSILDSKGAVDVEAAEFEEVARVAPLLDLFCSCGRIKQLISLTFQYNQNMFNPSLGNLQPIQRILL